MNNETLDISKCFLENQSWIIPLLVTLLSLFGALIGGWLSGRKKIGIEVISKNRQDWIHELRNIVKDFLTQSSKLFQFYPGIFCNKNYKKNAPFPTLFTLTELYNFESRLYSYQKELTKNTQTILKAEWERVKKGI